MWQAKKQIIGKLEDEEYNIEEIIRKREESVLKLQNGRQKRASGQWARIDHINFFVY